jgi:hypothetical protein
MTTRTLLDLVTEAEIEAEHQRALVLIREDQERQHRLRLAFARPAHLSALQDVRSKMPV